MNETDARAIARIFGGTPEQTGGNHWVVSIARPDGAVIVISDDVVALYPDAQAWGEMDDLPPTHITLA